MENIGLIIAISAGTFGIIAVMITMFLWVRGEASGDRKYFSQIQAEDRKDMLELIRAIDKEIRDFHHRLLEVERARKNQ